MMLTKSDFLIYIKSPLHLWAKKNNQYSEELTEYDKHLIKQGYEVEALAREYVRKYIDKDAIYQKEYKTEELLSKADIVVGNNIYEVKSTTSIEKEHKLDVCFQYYTASKIEDIDNIYLIYLNKEYVREGDIDLKELFIVKDMTEYVKENLHTVEGLIKEAELITKLDNPKGLLECYRPKECPCINLCHPNLPEYSIYSIAKADEKKLRLLKEDGILDIKDVPDSFKLSGKQRKQVDVAKSGNVYINKELVAKDLEDLQYPIYFLDYETYSWALPQYSKHKVYQFVVFQYSLHILSKDGELTHREYLCTTTSDPMKEILENLSKDIKEEGSILVWNKSFEMGCNKEMARIYPEYELFIEDINSRIYDLGDIFSKQMYIDPKFKGSWSIKNVLPVLVPTLTYKGMDISNGTEAMVNWEKIVYGKVEMKEREDIYDSLLKYCELDTLAMYEIYKYLITLL
ncbi:MAG: DUF2779 domain-containing protein [Candidatus Dojkabacteria bacterium]|nr:DUF2779 domain-containing protein [Candidatus Dojkabacteria bacterium]